MVLLGTDHLLGLDDLTVCLCVRGERGSEREEGGREGEREGRREGGREREREGGRERERERRERVRDRKCWCVLVCTVVHLCV